MEDEAEQIGAEMATRDDSVGQASHDGGAVGRDPAFAAVADVVGLEDQVLDDEVLVALEQGSRWELLGLDDDLRVDGELRGLGSFSGAGSFLGGGRVRGGLSRRGSLERAGSDGGPGLEALEEGDLVAQLLEEFGLLVNDLQQPLHQWGLLRLRNHRDRNAHALYTYELSASSSPDLLRCYGGLHLTGAATLVCAARRCCGRPRQVCSSGRQRTCAADGRS